MTGRRRTSSLVFSLPITLLPSIPLTLVAPILTTGDESRNPLDARLLIGVGSFTNRRQDSNANARGQVLSCLPQELIEKHEKTLFERDDIYTYYSNAFHVPFKRKWKLLVTNYENRPQVLPLLAPGYSQTCDYLLVMEYFFQFLVEHAISTKDRSRLGGIPFISFRVTRPKRSFRACIRLTKDPKDYCGLKSGRINFLPAGH